MTLIGFLFYRSHGVSERPDYRIDATLSRGALEWVTWSYRSERAQTFAYLASSFLVLIWPSSMCGFRACHDLQYKLKFIKKGFRMENLLRFWYWRFTDMSFIKRVNLSTFGFMIHCWTMMFLCIILMSSLLWFQRAKDHQKRSPDAKDIVVLVFGFPAVFQGAVVPPRYRPRYRRSKQKPVFSGTKSGSTAGAVVPLPGACFQPVFLS